MAKQPPRADLVAEGQVLVQRLHAVEVEIAQVRDRFDAWSRRLAEADADLAALEAFRTLLTKGR